MSMIKRLIAKTPNFVQEELKRYYFRHQIKHHTFTTDEPEYDHLADYVSVGDWVIDVGANIGRYTNRLSELVGPTGRVIAFEPVPATFSLLAANTQSCPIQNITLLNAAASGNTSVVGMNIPVFDDTGMKNFYQANIQEGNNHCDLSTMTLSIDELNLPYPVSLIKIDAEGHEPAVLEGAWTLIERDRPALIIEAVDSATRHQLSAIGYHETHFENSPNFVFTYKRPQ